MTIRHFEEADLPAIITLLSAGMAEIGATLDELKLKHSFTTHDGGSGLGLVVLKEKEVVGAAGILLHEPEFAEITQLYLLKTMRGEGKGKFLLDMLLNFAKNHCCKRVVTFLNPNMEDSIEFFKRNDFKEAISPQGYLSYAPTDRKIPFVLKL